MKRLSPRVFLSSLALAGFTFFNGFTLSVPIQDICLKRAQQMPKIKAFLPSLVCGKKLRSEEPLFKTLTHLGLIHMFVISGAHLVFLQQLLRRLFPPTLVLYLLFFYTLMVGAHPPVLRAWLTLWILSMSDLHKITPGLLTQAVLLTGFIEPNLTHSGRSIALSWVAVSTLMWSHQHKKQSFHLIWLYLTLIPLLLDLQLPHPFTILVNALIGPLVFLVLLPLSFITWIFPLLQTPMAIIWNLFDSALTIFAQSIPSPYVSGQKISPLAALTYAAGLHFLFFWIHILKVRKRCSAKAS